MTTGWKRLIHHPEVIMRWPGVIRQGNGVNSVGQAISKKVKPDRYGWDDVAQQIVGAFVLSAPISVTQEVWDLAQHLNPLRLSVIVFMTVLVTTLILYYTRFQRVALEEVGETHVPKRLLFLFIISYGITASVLWILGVIGIQIVDPLWSLKLVILVGFFSSIGAAAADILK